MSSTTTATMAVTAAAGTTPDSEYIPLQLTIKDIRNAVPPHLLKRNTFLGLFYVIRGILLLPCFAALVVSLDASLDKALHFLLSSYVLREHIDRAREPARLLLWGIYWWFQGLAYAGLWTLAHEAGHLTLSPHRRVNAVVGWFLHSFLLIPHKSWRVVHNTHHRWTNSVENEAHFRPLVKPASEEKPAKDGRGSTIEGGLPARDLARDAFMEGLNDSPVIALVRLTFQQALGLWTYFIVNIQGGPEGLKHSLYNPASAVFSPSDASAVIVSDLGVLLVLFALSYLPRSVLVYHYIIPLSITCHWIVLSVYLQHTSPALPHFRKATFNFQRGASSTVDRPLLGWMGRFFLHNLCHDHVAHHFFSQAPFYNLPQITAHLRSVLGPDYYHYDDRPWPVALWETFRWCYYIEGEGDIVWYKDAKGVARGRRPGRRDV